MASGLWPRLIPVPDALPDTALAHRYRAEARQTLALARDNPMQQILDLVLVQQWRFSDWRIVPGIGGGSPAIPEAADVRVIATALGP